MRPFADLRATVRDELRHLDGSRAALRRFGLTVGGVLAGVAAFIAWRHGWAVGPATGVLLGAGGFLVLGGLLAPAALGPVYRGWMGVAFTLGFVMTRVILTLVYLLVVTPIALLRRTLSTSPVLSRPDPEAVTYWLPREPDARPDRERLERMG